MLEGILWGVTLLVTWAGDQWWAGHLLASSAGPGRAWKVWAPPESVIEAGKDDQVRDTPRLRQEDNMGTRANAWGHGEFSPKQ